MVLSAMMAIHSAQVESVSLPAGGITLSGHLDSSFSFGMGDDAKAKWEPTASPHKILVHFKPSPALPELVLEKIHPFLPRLDIAFDPLASPILCPDEIFRSLPPILMLMSDGELFYKDLSLSPPLTIDC
jgi:acetyl esterase/lipase